MHPEGVRVKEFQQKVLTLLTVSISHPGRVSSGESGRDLWALFPGQEKEKTSV